MDDQKQTVGNYMGTLAGNTRDLMLASADGAGKKIGEARKRLAVAPDDGRQICGRVREKALEGAKAADQTVRENPYQLISIALGVGSVIGMLIARRCSRRA